MSTCQILHNDLKSNNVLTSFLDPKPWMSLTASSKESYNCHYPHISLQIVAGSGQQSIQSDVFSLGRIVLSILALLPTATAKS
ncbi:unnamed protein product, partial [Porites lobata]